MSNTTRKTIGRVLPGGDYVEITAELREDDSSGLSPGFSVTGELWESRSNASGRARKRLGREADSGGQIVAEMWRAAPELAELFTAHLADPDGVPMHAEANGWYFYSGAARRYEESRPESYYNREGLSDHERAARALSIPPEDLEAGLDREAFARFVQELRVTTWHAQAEAARVTLDRMVDGDGVEALAVH